LLVCISHYYRREPECLGACTNQLDSPVTKQNPRYREPCYSDKGYSDKASSPSSTTSFTPIEKRKRGRKRRTDSRIVGANQEGRIVVLLILYIFEHHVLSPLVSMSG
jgi:hypothetical protein